MIHLILTILMIMLNINEVNILKDSLLESIKYQVPTICYKRCTLNIMAERLKVNGWKKINHANIRWLE